MIGTAGAPSWRTTWDEIWVADPEVVVVAACGYDRTGTTVLAEELRAKAVLPGHVQMVAVDANASWARPGTRLVDGIEELADLLHPRD